MAEPAVLVFFDCSRTAGPHWREQSTTDITVWIDTTDPHKAFA